MEGIEIRIRPIDNKTKNSYDSMLKVAAHAFTNALIPITDIPDDDYEVLSCEIFKPGADVKSMDILLKGKKGFVNIEFHKQPLAKYHLARDFEYVVQYFFFYGEIIDQRIVVVDKERKSVDKLQIMPDLEYKGKIDYVEGLDGQIVLNTIKDKIKNNQVPNELELFIFSILPITDHDFDDEEKLMEELCNLTPQLNISEEDRDAIVFCQMILIELCVNDDYLKEKLLGVINMTSSFIQNRENALKRRIVVAEQTALNERQRADDAELTASNERQRADDAELTASNERQRADAEKKRADATEEILKEIVENNDIEFNKETMKKISSVTTIF